MSNISQKRRIILKTALASGAVGAAMSAGLAYTNPVTKSKNAWPKKAFNARSIDDALLELTGNSTIIPSPKKILIKAPTIAENGVAHITVKSSIPDTESISIFIPNNTSPLVANFKLTPSVINTIITRIKIESSGEIIAIIKANNKLYSAMTKMRLTVAK
ncbi:thiosulfate oxidation carrier protein SoxY [Pseudomonadota bacterium]